MAFEDLVPDLSFHFDTPQIGMRSEPSRSQADKALGFCALKDSALDLAYCRPLAKLLVCGARPARFGSTFTPARAGRSIQHRLRHWTVRIVFPWPGFALQE